MIKCYQTKCFATLLLICLISTPTITLQISTGKDPNFKSNQSSTRTDQWILDLQANFNNPQWYYDNLNNEDRQKIRQALDYAIPRQEIIDNEFNGQGFLLATTVLPQMGVYFNPNVQPREYNPNKSLNLLSEVFGYTWSEIQNDPITPINESQPYFKMTITVPDTGSPLRTWIKLILSSYLSIGVVAIHKTTGWSTIIDRILNNEGFRYNYDNGGFDALLIGWSGDKIPLNRFFFHSISTDLNGGNYQGIIDPVIDALIELQESTKSDVERIKAFYDQQELFYVDVWRNILFQSTDIYAYDSNLIGFNPYFGSSAQYQNLTFKTGAEQNRLVVAIPAEFTNFNPYISNSWYDNWVLGTTHYGLLTTSTPSNTTTYTNYQIYNMFADWWNRSDNGLTFFFNLKQGLKWENGNELNTSDVKFSYEAMINGDFPGNREYQFLMKDQSNGGIIIHNSTLIEFRLNQWDPFAKIKLFTLPILPKAQLEDISLDQWKFHSTNTNTTLLSNGPYRIESIIDQTAYLKNSSIWTPAYYSKFSEVPYMSTTLLNGGNPTISNITIVMINQPDDALTSLKNGEIDIIDPNFYLGNFIDQITEGGQATYQTYYGSTWQELGLNQGSPVWGLSPINPNLNTSSNNVFSTSITHQHPESETTNTADLISEVWNTLFMIIWGTSLFSIGALIAEFFKRLQKN